jgi:hypothetical protein
MPFSASTVKIRCVQVDAFEPIKLNILPVWGMGYEGLYSESVYLCVIEVS